MSTSLKDSSLYWGPVIGVAQEESLSTAYSSLPTGSAGLWLLLALPPCLCIPHSQTPKSKPNANRKLSSSHCLLLPGMGNTATSPVWGTQGLLLCSSEFCRPTLLESVWADSASETFAVPTAFPAWCVHFHTVLQAIYVAIWWNIYLECLICILITP